MCSTVSAVSCQEIFISTCSIRLSCDPGLSCPVCLSVGSGDDSDDDPDEDVDSEEEDEEEESSEEEEVADDSDDDQAKSRSRITGPARAPRKKVGYTRCTLSTFK